jgi:hypothetical protein
MAAGDGKLADPFIEREASIAVRNDAAKGWPRDCEEIAWQRWRERTEGRQAPLRLCGFLPTRQGDSGSLKLDKISKLRHGIDG